MSERSREAVPGSSDVPPDETLYEKRPSVHHHEQQKLERQRYRHRRDHHHAHGKKDIGNDEVDGDEGKVEHEAYLESLGEFSDGERWDEDEHAVLLDESMPFLGPDALGRCHEHIEDLVFGVGLQEALQVGES